MATLKRQQSDGTWEYVEVYGKFVRLTEDFVADSDNVSIIPLQNSYSKSTDLISVYYEGVKLNEDEHFKVSPNSQSVELLGWVINTSEKIEIEILKNASNTDNLASGSQLFDRSIEKIKLSQAVQDEINNKIDTNEFNLIENEVDSHVNNSDIHVTSEDRDYWNEKQDNLGYTPANETGIKNTGTSGGTAFMIEETDATKRPAIFLKNNLGRRAGFFWYGSEYPNYAEQFRIHLDTESDVLFTNVNNVLVDGNKVYHEGNAPAVQEFDAHLADDVKHGIFTMDGKRYQGQWMPTADLTGLKFIYNEVTG